MGAVTRWRVALFQVKACIQVCQGSRTMQVGRKYLLGGRESGEFRQMSPVISITLAYFPGIGYSKVAFPVELTFTIGLSPLNANLIP